MCLYEFHQDEQGNFCVTETKRELTQPCDNLGAICNNYYAIGNRLFDFHNFSFTFDSDVVALYDKGILVVGTALGDVFCVAESAKDQVYRIDHVDGVRYVQVTIDTTRSTQNAVYNVQVGAGQNLVSVRQYFLEVTEQFNGEKYCVTRVALRK